LFVLKKRSGKKQSGVCLCWLVWFGLAWFGLVALGCWLVEKMLGKIAKWLFLGSLLLVIAFVCFEKKVMKKMEYVSWFGLVWVLWVVGWLKKCWGK
jgi:hypothetical protein